MPDINNFQRLGSISNAHVGADFEVLAKAIFEKDGTVLMRNHNVMIGFGARKKARQFDLGCENPGILIECKSHTWTSSENVPSAKLTVWNEAMLYFHLAPVRYRKILFCLKVMRGKESLAAYYARRYGHLVPPGVEIWEYDVASESALPLRW